MRIVGGGTIKCDFTQCQSRGDFLTCYHDEPKSKAKYSRCELYQLRLKIDRANNIARGLENEV